jgi:glycosyl-4,4'-diaponeurosporenoate acyltransferase
VTNGQVVVLDALAWAGWSAAVGYAAHRLPLCLLDHDGPVTRLRRWERGGRVYERLGIRRWKDRLPEFGAVFRGGTSKRSLPSRGPAVLARFTAETRRAEFVHWAIPLLTPVFALWNPAWLFGGMVAYAVLANAPCLVVQRYNRGRLERVLARRPAPVQEPWTIAPVPGDMGAPA